MDRDVEDYGTKQWYALRVRSRHEFVTHEELRKKGIVAYLPVIKKWRQWKDRKKLVEFPLFPGYLFINMQLYSEEYAGALKARGVLLLVSQNSQPIPIPHEEIHSLRLMVESEEELNIYPRLKKGVRVKIIRGPLKGAEGVLDKREQHFMFHVNVFLLNKCVGVKVCAEDIEEI